MGISPLGPAESFSTIIPRVYTAMDSPLNELNNYLQEVKPTSWSWVDVPSGPKHDPLWTSTFKLNGVEMGTGSAKIKRLARTVAARIVLAAVKGGQETDTAAS